MCAENLKKDYVELYSSGLLPYVSSSLKVLGKNTSGIPGNFFDEVVARKNILEEFL